MGGRPMSRPLALHRVGHKATGNEGWRLGRTPLVAVRQGRGWMVEGSSSVGCQWLEIHRLRCAQFSTLNEAVRVVAAQLALTPLAEPAPVKITRLSRTVIEGPNGMTAVRRRDASGAYWLLNLTTTRTLRLNSISEVRRAMTLLAA